MAWKIENDLMRRDVPFKLDPEQRAWYRKLNDDRAFAWRREHYAKGGRLNGAEMGLLSGFPFPIPDFPYKVTLTCKPCKLPPLMPVGVSIALPESIIELIERLEPGVHGYWPTEMVWQDGTPVADKRWLLNVRNRLATLLPELSKDMRTTRPPPGELGEPEYIIDRGFIDQMSMTMKEKIHNAASLYASKERIGDHVIWQEYRMNDGLFFSDRFADALGPEGRVGKAFTFYVHEV